MSKFPHPASEFKDFDESLLEINLQKTVEQRIIAHDDALEVALEFQRAGQELYKSMRKDEHQ